MKNLNGKTRVGILFGGVSGEHEVSLMSAHSILNAISKEKYQVIQLGIGRTGQWWSGDDALAQLASGLSNGLQPVFMQPFADRGRVYRLSGTAPGTTIGAFEPIHELDVIFPLLHGTFGEDGNLQGYLELMDIPYVGANVAASAVCMEKDLFKDIMRAHNIPVVDAFTASRVEVKLSADALIARAEANLHYPLFVKPVNLGSSVGVSMCRDRAELLAGMLKAARYSTRILIEQGVDALEIEVSVLGNALGIAPNAHELLVSIPGQVRYTGSFYSYQAKYFDDTTQLVIPAPIPSAAAGDIRRIAAQVYQAVGCDGMARIDFLLEKAGGKIYVNELNTIPGFTHASMYPRLWEHSGIPLESLIDRLIDLAFARHQQRQQTSYRYEM